MSINPNVTRVQRDYRSIDLTGASLHASSSDTIPKDTSVLEGQEKVTHDQPLHDTAFPDPAFYLTNTKPSGKVVEKR